MLRFAGLLVIFMLCIYCAIGQDGKGRVLHVRFSASSILGNPAGEDALRRLTIYLPPGYEKGGGHYPVIYFLHGMYGEDSATMADLEINRLLDTAIANRHIRPVIFVLPNSMTKFKGSFYTNSALTGNWADYIAKDVVQYMDRHFRTIPRKESRGISGASMGGNGALKMGMLYPEVFSTVYASTPATLNWSDGINTGSEAFKVISEAKSDSDIFKDNWATIMVDLARTYSPNLQKPPFYADMPAFYRDGHLVVDSAVVGRWTAHFATHMMLSHVDALKSLRAIKIDWGRNDAGKHVPVTCLEFSRQLEALGITHYAEEYLGGHAEHLEGTEGRIYTEILPFFNAFLSFKR